MDFNLSKEQELLRDGLTKFLSTRYDLEKSRAAAKTGAGWQPEIWRAFADELGILGATLPEEVGGIGGGPVELMVITEALGHALVVEPYVDTVVVGRRTAAAGRAASAATSLLEKIVAGTAIVALAAAESESGDRWQDVATTARARRRRLGSARPQDRCDDCAAGHPSAGHRDDRRRAIAVPRRRRLGGRRPVAHGYRTIDDRRAADLVFDGLRLPAGALLGEDGQAWPSLEQARDEGRRRDLFGSRRVHAKSVGGHRRVLQAASAVRRSRSAASRCCSIGWSTCTWSWSRPSPRSCLPCCTSTTSRPCGPGRCRPPRRQSARAARFIGQQAVQLHGGMGMTEELAIGHYFKRLTADAVRVRHHRPPHRAVRRVVPVDAVGQRTCTATPSVIVSSCS